jgi:hypothetical protein
VSQRGGGAHRLNPCILAFSAHPCCLRYCHNGLFCSPKTCQENSLFEPSPNQLRFKDYADAETMKARAAAERLARAAAWEREKGEAEANKLRGQRLKRRAEDARHMRHAAVLRRFWQTHSGVTWQDAVVVVAAVALTAGFASLWPAAWQLGGGRGGGRVQGEGSDASSSGSSDTAAASSEPSILPQHTQQAS